MRAAVYGTQYISDRNNNFVAINIGYNFYIEHEHGVDKLVNTVNSCIEMPEGLEDGYQAIYKCSNQMEAMKIVSKLNKLQKKAKKETARVQKRWANTPFGNNIISPVARVFQREIIIDNTGIQGLHSNFLTTNGKYTLLGLGDGYTKGYWHKKFGNRRKFTEEDFFYMPDYSRSTRVNNIGFMIALGSGAVNYKNIGNNGNFAGAWGDNGIILLIRQDMGNCANGIVQAIKNGNLAIVEQEGRIMKDRGCILIDLKAAYGV